MTLICNKIHSPTLILTNEIIIQQWLTNNASWWFIYTGSILAMIHQWWVGVSMVNTMASDGMIHYWPLFLVLTRIYLYEQWLVFIDGGYPRLSSSTSKFATCRCCSCCWHCYVLLLVVILLLFFTGLLQNVTFVVTTLLQLFFCLLVINAGCFWSPLSRSMFNAGHQGKPRRDERRCGFPKGWSHGVTHNSFRSWWLMVANDGWSKQWSWILIVHDGWSLLTLMVSEG